MKAFEDLSFDEQDDVVNPRAEEQGFDAIVDRVMSRRDLFKHIIVVGSVASLGSEILRQPARAADSRLIFDAVPANTFDDITLPPGYSSRVVVSWGDPLWSEGSDFDPVSRGTAKSQALAFGDNVDGMHVFEVDGRTLLVANNEYTNRLIMWGNRAGRSFETADDVHKGMLAHGVTVVEIKENKDGWSPVLDSQYNRRITPETEMELTGPAAGHDLLKTDLDKTGTRSFGTWNNCGNGNTPWGTYLTCEENFNGYFSSSDAEFVVSPEMERYSISAQDRGYGWAQIDQRFDISKHVNESNRSGYVVEIDPSKPDAMPKKRTALGRIKHENAEVVLSRDGHVVVYMGDDERGEFLYRFVSNGIYESGVEVDDLLENGKLYVARFDDNGDGQWLELNPGTTGMASQAEICVHTRIAASAVGATTMDRPEWVAANTERAEVYVALSKNKNRGRTKNKGGDDMPVNGPNPRKANRFGQIVRWQPAAGDHAADTFKWELFLLAGNPSFYSATDAKSGSENITPENMFNAPDGLHFDDNGLLWIQTDGWYQNNREFEGHGNNQMLVADPVTGEVRRFLVGPNECEVTGLSWSPDRRTLFVGIQHPGERGNSHWPEGGDAPPRSSVIAITRDDGELMG